MLPEASGGVSLGSLAADQAIYLHQCIQIRCCENSALFQEINLDCNYSPVIYVYSFDENLSIHINQELAGNGSRKSDTS